MLRIEAFNLLNARSCILRQVEDVDLAVGEDDPHADRWIARSTARTVSFLSGVCMDPLVVHFGAKRDLGLLNSQARRPRNHHRLHVQSRVLPRARCTGLGSGQPGEAIETKMPSARNA